MIHILDTSHEELERTHRLVDTYRARHIWSLFYSLFPGSFKKVFREYAEKKEELILLYMHLHNDISTKKVDPTHNEFISTELFQLTDIIDICFKLLSRLHAHSHTQKDILKHEKIFFAWLLESFRYDILAWVWANEQAALWQSKEYVHDTAKNPISESIDILKAKKQELEEYIKQSSKK